MKLHFRRGFAVAAGAGLLAFGLAACGGTTDDAGSSNSDNTQETQTEPQTEEAVASLGCDDLGDIVWGLAPDPEMRLGEMPNDQFNTLAIWMVDNGGDFEDTDLGALVVEWGTLGPGYYEKGGEALSDADSEAFEAASEGIDASCDGLGFGFEEEF
ncbi:hypothetical protein ACFQ3B_14280 [Stackebrandtia endophytica]|nr:hypothetical protein [Stackebrandtia endophytica]